MLTPELFGTALYGILSLVGGIFGYIKSGSKVSLISGGISGLILLFLAVFIYAGNQKAGFVAAVIITLLVVIFAIRWFKTKKIMPAVPMIFLGVVSLVLVLS